MCTRNSSSTSHDNSHHNPPNHPRHFYNNFRTVKWLVWFSIFQCLVILGLNINKYFPSLETACGTILTETPGIIVYKPYTLYNNGERCVWTIDVPGAVQFSFDTTEYGINDTNDGVLITSLIRDGKQYFNLTTSIL